MLRRESLSHYHPSVLCHFVSLGVSSWTRYCSHWTKHLGRQEVEIVLWDKRRGRISQPSSEVRIKHSCKRETYEDFCINVACLVCWESLYFSFIIKYHNINYIGEPRVWERCFLPWVRTLGMLCRCVPAHPPMLRMNVLRWLAARPQGVWILQRLRGGLWQPGGEV